MAGTKRIRWERHDSGERSGRQERGTHVDMGCDVNGYRTRRDADSGKAEMQSTNARTNDASSSTTTNQGGERHGQQRGRQLAATTERRKERTRERNEGGAMGKRRQRAGGDWVCETPGGELTVKGTKGWEKERERRSVVIR